MQGTSRSMSNTRFLDFQFSLAKRRFLQKPYRLISGRDRQSSGIFNVYLQNVEELKQVFNTFDSNRDGNISQEEYKAILRALGKGSMVAEVPKIFQVADLDGDGFINFKEFVEAQNADGGVKRLDIQNAFQTFDLNGDGKISPEEVMQILRNIGERCSLQDCRRMVRGVDADGDGLIDMDEFVTMMTRSLKN